MTLETDAFLDDSGDRTLPTIIAARSQPARPPERQLALRGPAPQPDTRPYGPGTSHEQRPTLLPLGN